MVIDTISLTFCLTARKNELVIRLCRRTLVVKVPVMFLFGSLRILFVYFTGPSLLLITLWQSSSFRGFEVPLHMHRSATVLATIIFMEPAERTYLHW